MPSSKRVEKLKQVGPFSGLVSDVVSVALVVVILSLAARTGLSRPGTYGLEPAPAIEGDDHAISRPVGASRGWGGNIKTEHVRDFPWIWVLFRNPSDEKNASPLDGLQAGFAIELIHNVFLIFNDVMNRATSNNQLMVAKRAADLVDIQPGKSYWPLNNNKGVGRLTLEDTSVRQGYGVFRLNPTDNSTYYPPWPQKWYNNSGARTALEGYNDKDNNDKDNNDEDNNDEDNNDEDHNDDYESGEGRQAIPEINPKCQVRRYPALNENQYLSKNCYLYTFSTYDWEDVKRGAAELGLPESGIYDDKLDMYYTNETRRFVRWPVKMAGACSNSRCRFVFDSERYWEEHARGKYIVRRARICDGFQDVGAPIMCSPGSPIYTGYSNQGIYAERAYSKLSYLVMGVHKADTKPGDQCHDSIMGLSLAGDLEKTIYHVIGGAKIEYKAEFDKRFPHLNPREFYRFLVKMNISDC